LYFAILLIHLEKSTAQKDFFITHKHGTTYNCVTNSSFALSWIKEDIEEDADSVSAYIPRPDLNSFNCNITDDNRTRHYFVKTPWELKKPQDSDINEIILDERWEGSISDSIKYTKPIPVISRDENLFDQTRRNKRRTSAICTSLVRTKVEF
jgi:hypothetical protein